MTEGDTLRPGDVRRVRIFGTDRVVFRGKSGTAFLMGAYCAHLGAHLGEGGRVEGDALVCPFHRWQYDGASGVCTKIPYSPTIPSQARIETHPLVERHGLLFTPYPSAASAGAIPAWEGIDAPGIRLLGRRTFDVHTHPQELVENTVDSGHFPALHRTALPDPEVVFDDDVLRVRMAVRVALAPRRIGATLQLRCYGLESLTVETAVPGLPTVTILQLPTPVEDDLLRVRHLAFAPVGEGALSLPRGAVARLLAWALRFETQPDLRVWEHKVYRSPPTLCANDGPIGRFRTWSKRFYPAPLDAG